MTIEEKLKYFTETALQESEEQSKQTLNEYQVSLDNSFKQYQEEILAKVDLEIKYNAEQLRNEGNKKLSKEHLLIRRNLIQKNTELVNKIFDEVDELLEDYKKTPDYVNLLTKQIKEAAAFAKGDSMICYLDPADEDKKAVLEKATTISLTISEYSFGGGTRAVIPSRNILIDNSFESKLADSREHFRFSGGTAHDN